MSSSSENGEELRQARDTGHYGYTLSYTVSFDAVRVKPQYLVPSSVVCCFYWRPCSCNLDDNRVRVNTKRLVRRSTLTTSAKTWRVMLVRVACFQIVSPVIDDGVDGHDLYLARVVEGHYFGKVLCFGFVLEHHRDRSRRRRRIRFSFSGVER